MDPPCLLHEDEDLVALAKPAGVGTHRADEHAQLGFYEWARSRRPEWKDLGLLHRLDKETSGVLVLSKTSRGARAVTTHMEARELAKRYVFLTPAREGRPREQRCDDRIEKPRNGLARLDPRGAEAETEFTLLERRGAIDLVEARPRTGRTHQVRLHAARLGMPIVGDSLYGGVAAARLFLHAASLELPGGKRVSAEVPASFELAARERPSSFAVAVRAALEERLALLDAGTDSFRWLDGPSDGVRDVRVERLGEVALVLRPERAGEVPRELLEALLANGARAVVERVRPKDPREGDASVRVLAGELAAKKFRIREEGLHYIVDLEASVTSTGIFFDQRENRRRLAGMDLRGKTVLNAFAHAGAFSVAGAAAGATTTSLDLSKRYLDWARENLAANGIDPAAHDFIYGDALDWLRRLGKKGRRFDVVVLDPPAFSTTKKGKAWSASRDLGSLVALGLGCLAPGGTLFVSTNQRSLQPARFLALIREGFEGRKIAKLEYGTLPLDYRSGAGEPAWLKAAWMET